MSELETLSTQPIDEAVAHCSDVHINGRQAAVITFRDDGGRPFGWSEIASGLSVSSQFVRQWNQVWADLPFDFEWKPVPIHPYTAKTHPFFAVAYPARFRSADPSAFKRYLGALPVEAQVAEFDNLSGDATLIVPTQTGTYGHLAQFCRTAPSQAQDALWQKVAKRCLLAIEERQSIWCNTHGHGVPWLHVRLDSRLKYASFPPRGSISPISQAIWYEQIYPLNRDDVYAVEL